MCRISVANLFATALAAVYVTLIFKPSLENGKSVLSCFAAEKPELACMKTVLNAKHRKMVAVTSSTY